MRTRNRILGLVLVLGVTAGGIAGVKAWADRLRVRRDADSLTLAGEFLNEKRPADALDLYRRSESLDFPNPTTRTEWRMVKLHGLTQLLRGPQLAALYETHPELFARQEQASRLLIAWLDLNGKAEWADRLRNSWKGREVSLGDWVVLDVERLVKRGRFEEAIDLLEKADLKGEADARRWLRMAFLAPNAEIQVERLNEALRKHPRNAEIRRARARFFESQGNIRAAGFEHSVAIGLNRAPVFIDDAARFFIRHGSAETALSIWEDAPATNLIAQTHVQIWGRLIRPHRLRSVEAPSGSLAAPFAQLDATAFWNSSLDALVESESTPKSVREEARLLQLLESLRIGAMKETEALFEEHFSSDLAGVGLREIRGVLNNLNHLLVRRPELKPYESEFRLMPVDSHPLFVEWNRAVALWKEHSAAGAADQRVDPREALIGFFPASYQRLLNSRDIWSAALLASGLREAGLKLSPTLDDAGKYPVWFQVDYCRALRANRGGEEALRFLLALPEDLALVPVIGELKYALSRPAEAREVLRGAATVEHPFGAQSARLLAADLIRSGDIGAAAEVVRGNSLLLASDFGKELLMRIAIASKRYADAGKIAAGIAANSESARQYLILRSLSDGEFKIAEIHARALVAARPDRPDYREALQGVLRARRAGANQ